MKSINKKNINEHKVVYQSFLVLSIIDHFLNLIDRLELVVFLDDLTEMTWFRLRADKYRKRKSKKERKFHYKFAF